MFMGNAFLRKWGYVSFKADRNKLFASNEKQTDNHTSMLDMLHSNMSVVCTYHCRGVFHELFFGVAVVLCWSFQPKKAGKSTELKFLCTQGTLQGGRVEDHKLMFTRQLHSPQLYNQAILYIYKTDHMMPLTLYTLTSVCIFSILFSIHLLVCWQGEFV